MEIIRKILAVFGYVPIRANAPQVSWDNFSNLVQVYEQRINNEENLILPNETRTILLGRLLGTPPSEAYFIAQALSKCKDLKGDVCEFGVAQGETSAFIANEIVHCNNKRLHLFDSFAGLPSPSEKDQLKNDIFSLGSMEAYTGAMSCPEEMVHARLKTISFPTQRYVIHKGFIEHLIDRDKNLPENVCFAYVDFDFYEPIKVALSFLHQVTPKGAIIIVDDYDFFSTGSKTAVDEFIEEKNSTETIYNCFVPNTNYGHFCIVTKIG